MRFRSRKRARSHDPKLHAPNRRRGEAESPPHMSRLSPPAYCWTALRHRASPRAVRLPHPLELEIPVSPRRRLCQRPRCRQAQHECPRRACAHARLVKPGNRIWAPLPRRASKGRVDRGGTGPVRHGDVREGRARACAPVTPLAAARLVIGRRLGGLAFRIELHHRMKSFGWLISRALAIVCERWRRPRGSRDARAAPRGAAAPQAARPVQRGARGRRRQASALQNRMLA